MLRDKTLLSKYLIGLLSTLIFAAPALGDFNFEDFSDVSGLQLNGDASQVGNKLRLSNAARFSGGSVFIEDAIALGEDNSFSTNFLFGLTDPGGISDSDGIGADGLVFVVQPNSNDVGGKGGGIGYSGIENSLGIEFDTWNNGGGFGDVDGNHVGIDLFGNINSVFTVSEPIRFNDGDLWNVWIDYDGPNDLLEVRWSLNPSRPTDAQIQYSVDLTSVIGQDTAFVGFTSATGSAWNNHDLHRWEFRGEFAPVVPEPGSLPVLLATCCLSAIHRPRR